MYFKILKSSIDGICGGESRYETIEEVLREILYFKGWESQEQMRRAVRNWAKSAKPGSTFCTYVSAIIAFPVDSSCRIDDVCHHCGYEGGLDYQDIDGVEGGNLEQEVTCPNCNRRWIDVFVLADQREQSEDGGGGL